MAAGAVAFTVIAAMSSCITSDAAFAETPVYLAGQAPLSIDDPGIGAEALYLEQQFDVSESEALRRLDMQRNARLIAPQLAARFPAQYAGMWIDQESGGIVRIKSTSIAPIESALQGVPDRVHYQVETARWSLAQLNASAKAIDARVNASGSRAEVVVDEQENDVAVYVREGAEALGASVKTSADLNSAERKALSADPVVKAAVSAFAGQAVLRQLVIGKPKSKLTRLSAVPATNPPACPPTDCDPPMRGGMRLNSKRTSADYDSGILNPWWGECTNGFNMMDNTRSWNYILTAGHCMTGPYHVGMSYTYDYIYSKVSDEVYNFENGPTSAGQSVYPIDYSIQPYDAADDAVHYWLPSSSPRNLVDVYCWSYVSTASCPADQSVSITDYDTYAQAWVGFVVCMTGSGDNDPDFGYASSGALPGTRCGRITGKDGGLKTDICSRDGDSGAPLFSADSHTAFGILNGGTPGSGDCPSNPPGTEYSQFSPIDKILTHVKNQTLDLEGKDYKFALCLTAAC